MAKLTKEEKLAAAQAANEEYELQRAVGYLPRLMAALEAATTNANMELTVENNTFRLLDRDSQEPFALALTFDPSAWALDDLESRIDQKARQQVEDNRKYLVRIAALAKLNKEEKELLNLK
jgi:hypothetical protein